MIEIESGSLESAQPQIIYTVLPAYLVQGYIESFCMPTLTSPVNSKNYLSVQFSLDKTVVDITVPHCNAVIAMVMQKKSSHSNPISFAFV